MSAVVAMNEETRRMEQFNDIVSNIKPLMTVGKGKNSKQKRKHMPRKKKR